MTDIEKQLIFLREEIEHKAIYRTKPGTVLPAKQPNTIYTWQFYLRRVLFDPKFVFTAANLLVEMLPSKDVQFAACEDAGVPLGLAMSAVIDQPLLSVKKARKAYGLLNFTEGTITGKPIVLVDDLAGSQTTLRTAAATLRAFKAELAPCYVTLINKTRNTHDAYLKSNLISLFTCADFNLTWQDYIAAHNREPNFGAYF
jgi:orotate phosphoribosyltransferase